MAELEELEFLQDLVAETTVVETVVSVWTSDRYSDHHNLFILHLQVKMDILAEEVVVDLLPHTHQVLEVKAV